MNVYRVTYYGLVRKYGVMKEVCVIVNTNCEWTDSKLQAAMRDASSIEPEMADLEVTYLQKINEHRKKDFLHDREINLDQLLGI